MSVTQFGRTIDEIAIIGSGTIGPDIALYFTKRFHDKNVPVTVVDIDEEALEGGRKKMKGKFEDGVEHGVFEEEEVQSMLENVTWTDDYDQISNASLVVEAATEKLEVKRAIFEELEQRVSQDAILASNSSHYTPERIFAETQHPGRCLVIHYFTPAERNPIVEIAPEDRTRPDMTRWAMQFYEELGKAPIEIGSRYGHALNPIFEGLVLAAIKLVEDDYGTVREIDAMVRDALELGAGPFTVMNLTEGNHILKSGLQDYNEKILDWYEVPDLLEQQIEEGTPWPVAGRDETVDYDTGTFQEVRDEIRGALFGLSTEALESGIAGLGDLEMGIELALDVRAPFRWMNEIGTAKALSLVEGYARKHDGFPVPEPLREHGEQNEPWEIPVVFREDRGDIAVVKIRRFKKLNAMNKQVFEQLERAFTDIAGDENKIGAVLTGFGRKAFVSGADINRFPDLHGKPAEATRHALEDQEIVNYIEQMDKPVVCALNGLALGGGSELAMGCHARVAREGVQQIMGQPEPRLGIIPGMGGTQRLPRLIPFREAWKILRTAGHVRTEKAVELGLVREAVRGDRVVSRAAELVEKAVEGEIELDRIETDSIHVPDDLPDVDIGHLSEKIDELLQKAILEGAETNLEEGLKIEADYFGKCFETEDNRIGVQNFLEHGPRKKAAFVDA